MRDKEPQSATYLLHQDTCDKIKDYLEDLAFGNINPGAHVKKLLGDRSLADLKDDEFLSLLINTKKPQIFAESSVFGDGTDWNQQELSILGDISVAVPVTVYDDGLHRSPAVHNDPFDATLVYVPGALLRNDIGELPADWDEVVHAGEIEQQAYTNLVERRLLPSLLFINASLLQKNKQGLVTIPGIGCGQFSGEFHGLIGELLRKAILDIVQRHVARLTNIVAIYFDPYSECESERHEIDHVALLVRPMLKADKGKPQLCKPQAYEETNDDFSGCELSSIVAWDHVSWPGNDFYIGNRATDDGVKAAATSSMHTLTGIQGFYNALTNSYNPPDSFRNWAEVVAAENLKLAVQGRVIAFV